MDERQRAAYDVYGMVFPTALFRFGDFLRGLPGRLLSDTLGMWVEEPLTLGEVSEDGIGKYPDPRWRGRHYNDPPEFFTFLNGMIDGEHWGLYVDDPTRPPFSIVSYYSNDAFEMTEHGEDLFPFLRDEIERRHVDTLEYIEYDPADADYYHQKLGELAELRDRVRAHGTADRPETGRQYLDRYPLLTRRQPVAATRDLMGIVVPPELYRPLPGPDLFTDRLRGWNYVPAASDVEDMAGVAVRLLDGGYPGAALKLGKDLWIYREHHGVSYQLLDAAYAALGRAPLREMLAVARDYRAYCERSHPHRFREKE